MEPPQPQERVERGASPELRRLWLLSGALIAVGVVVPGGGGVLALPGAVVLAVTAGVTAARGRSSGVLLVLAWAVPLVPTVTVLGFATRYAGTPSSAVEDHAPWLLNNLVGTGLLATWIIFGAALLVEMVRARRRRFGAPGPAWKNDPTPPSSS